MYWFYKYNNKETNNENKIRNYSLFIDSGRYRSTII